MDDVVPIPATFLRQATREAERYGADDWVFVRELVQNARDAGASTIRFDVTIDDDRETLSCDDDGTGMNAATVERHLLRLFSSSKTDDRAEPTIGRFGVGFWSILRFHPVHVIVDTRANGDAVALAIDLRALQARRVAPTRVTRGTTITLVRPRGELSAASLALTLRDRVRHYAGPVSGLDGGVPPALVACGTRVNSALTPTGFGERPLVGKGFRGSIALGQTPRIRLYARGLLVSETTSVDELLPKRERKPRTPLPGLHVRAAVDADGLDVLLDRQRVVESETLARVVSAIDREARALEHELVDRLAPLPPLMRVGARLKRPSTIVALGLAALVVVGVAVLSLALRAPPAVTLPSGGAPRVDDRALGALGASVDSPRIDTGADAATPEWAFRYTGRDGLLFKLGTLSHVDVTRGLVRSSPSAIGPYRGTDDDAPREDGVHVVARVEGGEAVVLPLPPGHTIRTSSMLVDGAPAPSLGESIHGEPIVVLPRGVHSVSYDTAVDNGRRETALDPSSSPDARARRIDEAAQRGLLTVAAPLPSAFRALIDDVAELPRHEQLLALARSVGDRVRYSTDPLDATLFDRSSLPFLDRVALFGAGDCDVQNGTLVLLARALGFPARLAIGFVGAEGRVAKDFHAWAEILDDGDWRIVDVAPTRPAVTGASNGAPAARAPTDGLPPSSTRAPIAASASRSARGVPASSGALVASDPRGAPARGAAIVRDDGTYDDDPRDDDARDGGARAGDLVPGLAAAATLVVVGSVMVFAWRSRKRRRVDVSDELAARMTEALIERAAAAPLSGRDPLALRLRRLVPTTDGARVSLADIARAVSDARACVARADDARALPLPRDVLCLDANTVDVRRLESLLAGLVDVREVARALVATTSPVALTLVERALSGARAVRLVVVPGASTGVLALADDRGTCVVAIGEDAPAVRRALALDDARLGAFGLARHVFAETSAFYSLADRVLDELAREVMP